MHEIEVSSPQSAGEGIRYVYDHWSDDGAISHTITTPGAATTYTADFTTQYYLTMNAGTGGTVSPASGWYNAGTGVQITATPGGVYYYTIRVGNFKDVKKMILLR